MKYIVYETTNTVNNKIYIGVHKTVNPDVFDGYIGCGVLATQPWSYNNPKTKFQYAVKKYGPKVFVRKTLAVFDNIEAASDLEEELVNEDFLARDDVYNMILGGFSDPHVEKVRTFQYDLDGNFIREYESIIEACGEMGCDHSLIGHAIRKKQKAKNFLWSSDKVDKLDVSLYNLGLNHQIPVHCYLKDGSYYKSYPNQTQAVKDLGLGSGTSVKESRMLGILVKGMYFFCEVKAETFDKARSEYIRTRRVYKYNGKTGDFICGYETQMEAESDNPLSNISKAIKMKKTCEMGYLWSLEELPKYSATKRRAKRRVGKYDLDGNLVKEYESATAAERENGTSVWKVLNGTNKTQKGHVYKYLD